MSIIENIQTYLDDSKYVASVFVDPKKVFDTVKSWYTHYETGSYGTTGVAKDWFISYLKGRKQFIVINETSTTKQILTGIPLGSVLGPLFIFYSNTIFKTYLTADDTSITQSSKYFNVLAKQLNQDLSNISYWLRANKLCLNMQKTELTFCPNNLKIDLYQDATLIHTSWN